MQSESRNEKRKMRARRMRSKISGKPDCPRLSVFRSLNNLSVQVIDDTKGVTMVAASIKNLGTKKQSNTVAGARELGQLIAKKCAEKKIVSVVFDRAGYKYHGKIKAVADGAREGGLQF